MVLQLLGKLFGWGKPNFHVPDWLVCLSVAIILGLPFVAGTFLGKRVARDALTSSPHVRLKFKSGDRLPWEDELVQANDQGSLRVLAQTKDLVVVFRAAKDPRHSNVFVLARADLSSVHLLPDCLPGS